MFALEKRASDLNFGGSSLMSPKEGCVCLLVCVRVSAYVCVHACAHVCSHAICLSPFSRDCCFSGVICMAGCPALGNEVGGWGRWAMGEGGRHTRGRTPLWLSWVPSGAQRGWVVGKGEDRFLLPA